MKRLMLVLMSMPMVLFASTTWFVDATHGSNGYSGKYSYAPKKTIQAAINAAAGDTICVVGGVYFENLTLSVAGVGENPTQDDLDRLAQEVGLR